MALIHNIGAFINWYALYAARYGLIAQPFTMYHRDGTRFLVRPGTDDPQILKSIFIKKHYLRPYCPITNDSIVLDVGANIGAFTVLAAQRAKHVYAFEPEPSNFSVLQENVAFNRLTNVKAFKAAISGASGNRQFFFSDPSASGGGSLYGEHSPEMVGKPVETFSIADFMRAQGLPRIDFLKLDCEGAENEIIDSLKPDTAALVSAIVMEFHRLDNRSPQEMAARLNTLGYFTSLEGEGGYIYAWRGSGQS